MGSAVAGVAGNSLGWIDSTANAEAAGGIIQAATRRRSLGTRKNARGRAPERSLFWGGGAKDLPNACTAGACTFASTIGLEGACGFALPKSD